MFIIKMYFIRLAPFDFHAFRRLPTTIARGSQSEIREARLRD